MNYNKPIEVTITELNIDLRLFAIDLLPLFIVYFQ